MTPSPRDVTIRREPAVVGTDVGNLHVVLNPDLQYLGLDPIAARVWELLAQPQTVDDLVRQLTGEYEVDEATCRTEVSALVDTFAGHKLVSVG